jgi:dimeric dUTPase (all-alpha-NTP-PPase superfamily)
MNLFYKGASLRSKDDIKSWYVHYLELGYGLGFNIGEIKQAYFDKNKINFNRQENNY